MVWFFLIFVCVACSVITHEVVSTKVFLLFSSFNLGWLGEHGTPLAVEACVHPLLIHYIFT